ncbi:hypothetical protein XENORESO_000034 [Xenotaenia resolanae]|uniref:Uncharacterized protein n=1 Tax=Xenotaenia resolanae TaxID=208358 RepID=A0ABV0WW19_9TELE
MLREKRNGRRFRCDSPSLYGHMQPWHEQKVQSGKTYSFKAFINTQIHSLPSSSRGAKGKVESKREYADKFLNFERAQRLPPLITSEAARCGPVWMGGTDGWDQGHIWIKNGRKSNL